MKIIGYKKASNMPEKYYSSLIDKEIECWWTEPFCEYLICNECMWIYSIQEIHWNIDNYRKSQNINNIKCECWWITHLMYPKNEFLNLLKEYIKWQVSSVLLLDNDKVEWFWFLSKTTIWELIENEFNTRPNSYDKEEILKKIFHLLWTGKVSSMIIYDELDNNKIICMNHIYLPKELRKENNAYKISKNIFLNNTEYSWIPVVLETRYDSNFYPIWQSMWFETILSDKYGYIIQYLSDYQKILDFFATHDTYSDQKEMRHMIQAKRYALNILKKNPSFYNRKFYK